LKEKDKYYEEKSLIDLEEKKQKKIRNKFKLQKIYYSLDGKNIFKRVDRYYYKNFLIFVFSILNIYSAIEFISSIYLLVTNDDSKDFSDIHRNVTLSFNMINIIFIEVLATMTVVKKKIETFIYY
jgi:hypothetical protein